ncbi:MAG TPA: triphosphoribosyl-dephospho-CoA synthase [Vicinamibacterales bacterium]|nr:triphosphoribosyl-dephospho-CoA synthase [Vicinamibacterales bacterium]
MTAGEEQSRSPADAQIVSAAQLACLLEVTAPKPGNVSPGRHFADARFEDFLASAAAIGPPLVDAPSRPLGLTIRLAVEATSAWSGSNTNLGLILLLAPLVKAASIAWRGGRGGRSQSPGRGGEWSCDHATLRAAVRGVLEETSVDDAREVYAAIRLARPGGLGRAEGQDVADEPTVSLLDTMRLARGRDGIAHEYSTGFEVTFERAAPALAAARADGLCWDDAIVETFLTVLAARPDTHIARRSGARLAEEVSQQAVAALAAGGVRTVNGRRTIDEMDVSLRDAANRANPGTTADLTAAAIFVVLLGGGWHTAGGSHAATR